MRWLAESHAAAWPKRGPGPPPSRASSVNTPPSEALGSTFHTESVGLGALPLRLSTPPKRISEPAAQTPPEQTSPLGQGVLQSLQWSADDFRFVSQPLELSPSQSPKPSLQMFLHWLERHLAVPLTEAQGLPQGPPLVRVERVSVS